MFLVDTQGFKRTYISYISYVFSVLLYLPIIFRIENYSE